MAKPAGIRVEVHECESHIHIIVVKLRPNGRPWPQAYEAAVIDKACVNAEGRAAIELLCAAIDARARAVLGLKPEGYKLLDESVAEMTSH